MRIILVLALLVMSASAEAQLLRGRSGCGNGSCSMCYPQSGWWANNYTPVISSPIPQTLVTSPEPFDGVIRTFQPTPHAVVKRALEIAAPSPSEVVYDLGCGDARVLIAACRQYKCAGVGIENDPQTAALAVSAVSKAGISRSVRIVEADATKRLLSGADVIYLYLDQGTIERLHPTLADARIVLSFQHEIPQLPTTRIEWGKPTQTLYVYRR